MSWKLSPNPEAAGKDVLAPRNQTCCSQNRDTLEILAGLALNSRLRATAIQQNREILLYFSFTHPQLISWFYRAEETSKAASSQARGWRDSLVSLVALFSVFCPLLSMCWLGYYNSLRSFNHFPFVHLPFVFPFLQILQQMSSLAGTKAFKTNVATPAGKWSLNLSSCIDIGNIS